MKRTLLIGTLLASAMAFAQTVVCVDMAVALEHHPNTPADRQLLKDTYDDYSKKRDALMAEVEAMQEELTQMVKEAQNPMLSAARSEELRNAAEAKFRALEEKKASAEDEMRQCTRSYEELTSRLSRRTIKDIQEKLAGYAKEKGYDIVIDRASVPYVSDKCDITNNVIVLCGGTVPKADTSKAGEELAKPETLAGPDDVAE